MEEGISAGECELDYMALSRLASVGAWAPFTRKTNGTTSAVVTKVAVSPCVGTQQPPLGGILHNSTAAVRGQRTI